MHTHVQRSSAMFYCVFDASHVQPHLCYMCNTHLLFQSSSVHLSEITAHNELETNPHGKGYCLGHRHFLPYHVLSKIVFRHVKKVKLLPCLI